MKKVVIFDYGYGNIRSNVRAFEKIGADVEVSNDPQVALTADALVVPGVGNFGACMQGLIAEDGDRIVEKRILNDAPVLGICVGHQILFSGSVEPFSEADSELMVGNAVPGLGLFEGVNTEVKAKVVPHMGWNNVSVSDDFSIFKGLDNESFYFVHSYAVEDVQNVQKAVTEVDNYSFVSAVSGYDNLVTGFQFHPEKSGEAGLQLLSNWLKNV